MITVVKGKEFNYKIFFPETNGNPPKYEIKTPKKQVFLTGDGNKGEEDNFYEIPMTIPAKAPSSSVDFPWSIVWLYKTYTKEMFFDVRDPGATDDDIYQRELSKFVLANMDYRGRLVIPERPEDVSCSLFKKEDPIIKEIDVEIGDHRLGTELITEIDKKYLTPGEDIVIWFTEIQNYFQILHVTPVSMLPILSKIRFMIDRILKTMQEPQVYLDSELNASLYGGIEYINAWNPLTEWNIMDFPTALTPFLVYAGGWYALNSQYMLESDLAFGYSGQAVSLDYDRTGPIESEIGRLQEIMSEHLTKAKVNVLRKVQGTVGLTNSGLGPVGMTVRRNLRLVKNTG